MLKSWSIENFKAIVNSGDLKLAPVTILAGKNSSGKSSLLQSILMIAQTLSNQNRDLALLTNGDLAELRTFEDILSNYTQSSSIRIKFGLDNKSGFWLEGYEESTQIIEVTFSSISGGKSSSSAIEASKVAVEDVSISLIFKFEERIENENVPYGVEFHLINNNLAANMNRISDNKLKRISESVIIKRLQQRPSHLGLIRHSGDHSSYKSGFLTALFHFLPEDLTIVSYEDSSNLDLKLDLEPTDITEVMIPESDIVMVNAYLDRGTKLVILFFTSQIRYLGPFRAKPRITAQGFSTKGNIDDVGIEGEFAASVYHANQNAMIDWYNPHSKQVEKGTLKIALDIWVQYLGIAHQVTTEEAGLAGVMWKVVLIPDQKARTLPEVGVGLSQILPVLVMGILSPKDSLLIMEQPELHLHPKVQARLGDFFVGIAKCHKQCIIETHSENIVSQLRYHIVEAGGQEKSDCIIYFVDQDEKGAAKFEEVEISPNGNILNWPDGFFDETMHQENRINAASIKRRARLKKNG